MGSLSFFIRTMILTALVVLLLQVKWGTQTLEHHTMSFLTSSSLVKPIDETAGGAAVFIRNMWTKLTSSLNTNFSNALRRENQPGSRQSFFGFERSEKYVEKKADEVKEAAKEYAPQAKAELREAADNTSSIVEKFKRSAAEATRKARAKFIDETDVPGQDAADTRGDDKMESVKSEDLEQ